MPLTAKYKTDLVRAIEDQSGTPPCRRCALPAFRLPPHATRSCITPLEDCYRNNAANLDNNPLNATGDFDADVAEAEELFKNTIKATLVKEEEAKLRKKQAKAAKAAEKQPANPTPKGFKLPMKSLADFKATTKGATGPPNLMNRATDNPSVFPPRFPPQVMGASTAGSGDGAARLSLSAGFSAGLSGQQQYDANSIGLPDVQYPDAIPVSYQRFRKVEPWKRPFALEKNVIYATETKAFMTAEVSVMTNYLHIERVPDTLYVYRISNSHLGMKRDGSAVTTVFKKRNELRSIFESARDPHLNSLLQNTRWATDYTTIWTTKQILDDPSVVHRFKIDYIAYGGYLKKDMDIEIEHTDTFSAIRTTLQESKAHECSNIISALNAMLTQPVTESRQDFSVTKIGQNRFFLNEGYDWLNTVPGPGDNPAPHVQDISLRTVRGYFTSIRPGRHNHLFLNVNTATSTFLPPCRVSDILYWITVQDPQMVRDVGLDTVEKWLRGVQLRLIYDRLKVADREVDINDEKSRIKTFQCFGRSVETQRFYNTDDPNDTTGRTVLEYFTHDVGITNLIATGLCVNVGRRLDSSANPNSDMRTQSVQGASWIPAQLLELLPNQQLKVQLPPELVSRIIRAACKKPIDNAKYIVEEGLDVLRLKHDQLDPAMVRPDFAVGTNLVEVPATFLEPPVLQYRQGNHPSRRNVEHATWNLRGNDIRFQTSGAQPTINVFVLNTTLDVPTAEDPQRKVPGQQFLLRDMVNRLAARGTGAHSGIVQSGNMDALKTLLSTQGPGTSATLVIIHAKNQNTYAAIKRASDMHYGVRTVCAVGSKIPYYAQDILKFNFKCGGRIHGFDDANQIQTLLGQENQRRDTIVFGADVAHPPVGGGAGYPSIACVVASSDTHFQNFPGSMRLQAGRQEIIEDMESMVLERLEAWVKNAANQPQGSTGPRRLPSSILFYRDGLSDSQFDECVKTEVQAVENAFLELTRPPSQRYHHNTQRLNFYLQSHAAPNGTARSAHYHVLRDNMDFGSDNNRLANLTNTLCYSFPRALKGVSYAAPAYIADRLCERGRMYLRHWIPPSSFQLPQNDSGVAWTETAIKEWKQRKAVELSQSQSVWGYHYQHADVPGRPKRHNPWRDNLDDTMFWM